ncbi:acetyl-CoA carboxylase biotin carboxyl carrier protein [Variovorax sp. Root411]|uniref:acetyl-CoA carboxylase biotin carboxyl carrier protein n=1 Tax=Variovorax sp. Root411 TaxID=1736530 RepID=UPI0006F6A82E|nr:acetyl-CoA carboxylase biotin carboxyl carrier protein subunit [Variovorax sp. Root411]KQW61844.1 acetyl-CoA carboxylase biotin carboxyl carrier protein subunit [Variovorax sp. Root411]
MKQEQIKTLIDALAASDLAELEFSENGSTLRLVKLSALGAAPAARRPFVKAPPRAIEEAAAPPAASAECLAPLHGVVHLQPAPGEPPFVQPGQAVEAGQLLCVIEAMKMFNEVRAERDGIVRNVLARSGDEVEAGQPLFRFA